MSPWGSRYIPKTGHTRPDPCRWHHGRSKCDPSIGFCWLKSNKVPNKYFAYKSHTLTRISSCHAASTDFSDPLLPFVPIFHLFRQVFKAISCISIELLYICSTWSSNPCSSMWRDPQEYIGYEFVLTSPAMSRVSGSLNLDGFRDGRLYIHIHTHTQIHTHTHKYTHKYTNTYMHTHTNTHTHKYTNTHIKTGFGIK